MNNTNYEPPQYVALSIVASIRSPDIPFSTLFFIIYYLFRLRISVIHLLTFWRLNYFF